MVSQHEAMKFIVVIVEFSQNEDPPPTNLGFVEKLFEATNVKIITPSPRGKAMLLAENTFINKFMRYQPNHKAIELNFHKMKTNLC
jgi:hypothetical protein